MELNKIKKFLRKEIEELGDKIRFGKLDGKRLQAVITRENGRKENVYYRFENGKLVSDWYYTIEKNKETGKLEKVDFAEKLLHLGD